MSEAQTDSCRVGEVGGTRAIIGWGVPIVGIIVGSFVRELMFWLWIPAFTMMGVTCLINVRRCGRVHCYATGPLFLGMALFLVVVLLGLAPMRWIDPASIATVVAVILAYGSELIVGRYRS